MRTPAKYNDIAIVIAFPDNWAKGEKWRDRLLRALNITYTQYYKVGHAALLLINKQNGDIEYFDYGRYIAPKGSGRVRSKNTDPKLSIPIKARIDERGDIANLFEIMSFLESIRDDTHGHGKTYFSVCKNIDFYTGKQYINRLIDGGSIKYVTYGKGGMNCSSFVSRTVIKASGDRKTRMRLRFPQTLAPTPLGNVVNASENGRIWEMSEGVFTPLQMSRKKVLREMLQNILLSLWKNRHLEPGINHFIPDNHHTKVTIPDKAQLLSCLGESAWMHIYKNVHCGENEFVIESFTEHRKLNYSIIAKTQRYPFDLTRPYRFDYECNRLVTTILQNGKKITFRLCRENPTPTSPSRKTNINLQTKQF